MFVSLKKYKQLEKELGYSEEAIKTLAKDWINATMQNSELKHKVEGLEKEIEDLENVIYDQTTEIAELKEKYAAAVHKNYELAELLAEK